MRKASMLWIVALLFVAQNAQAQGFEGRIIQSLSVPQLGDEKMEIVMNVKGEKLMVSTDMGPGGVMKMYSTNGGKSMIMVMEQMNMGMEMDLEQASSQATTASAEQSAMKPTGKKETVNGYAAEEWVATLDENNVMTMWLSADFDKSLVTAMQTAMKAQNAHSQSAAQSDILKTLTEKGMVAVRTEMTMNGETAAIVDLVKIEKTSIADAIFVPDPSIQIQKMDPSMMQQGQD